MLEFGWQMPQCADSVEKHVMQDQLLLPLGTKSHQWEGFCLFLVVFVCHGKLLLLHATGQHHKTQPNLCALKGMQPLLLMQPVIWFALGIIALVKFSLGKICLLSAVR